MSDTDQKPTPRQWRQGTITALKGASVLVTLAARLASEKRGQQVLAHQLNEILGAIAGNIDRVQNELRPAAINGSRIKRGKAKR